MACVLAVAVVMLVLLRACARVCSCVCDAAEVGSLARRPAKMTGWRNEFLWTPLRSSALERVTWSVGVVSAVTSQSLLRTGVERRGSETEQA